MVKLYRSCVWATNTLLPAGTIALQQFLPVPIGNIGRRSASYRLGIYFMGFAGVIFRSEIALYLGIQVLYLLLQGRISLIRDIIPSGIAGGLVGLLTTISVDSYFWQTYSKSLQPPIFSTPFLTSKFGLIWPEFSAFHYNALQNNSSAWGTSPWHTYFTSSLPKLIMNPFALAVLLPLTVSQPGMKKGARDILVPILGYVAGYSGLPHKEWRFIIYVMPGLTLVAALGANWM